MSTRSVSYLKKSLKVNLYPWASENPAATTLDVVPTRVPLPPKQAPNARAYKSGSKGNPNRGFPDMLVITGI